MSVVGSRPRSAWIGAQHRAGWGFSDETLLSEQEPLVEVYPHLNSLSRDKISSANMKSAIRGRT